MLSPSKPIKLAVVIPCYKVSKTIINLLAEMPPLVQAIFVVDDCCPEKSGALVQANCKDPRVTVLYNPMNLGVGGAVCTGYRQALLDECTIIVKIDGDGQMNPSQIPEMIGPIVAGEADYTKGNRFFSLEDLRDMPFMRLFGNTMLSFINKAVSGYWNLMDPTNGFTAIHAVALRHVPLTKLDNRYFFESDLLFRLNTIRAVIFEVPMNAFYGSEKSNLNIARVTYEFPAKYLNRFFKRIFYNYILRDFNVCSLQILFGILFSIGGMAFGTYHFVQARMLGQETPAGTVMLAVLPLIIGFQLLLAAISFDTMNVPNRPLQRKINW